MKKIKKILSLQYLIEAKKQLHYPFTYRCKCIKNDDEKAIYTRDIYNIPNNEMGLDIGPKSCMLLKNYM